MKRGNMVLQGKKMSFAEAEEQEIFQWLDMPFSEKWQCLERMRKSYYAFHKLPFPSRVERVINKVKRWS